jgi:hypothetical protein
MFLVQARRKFFDCLKKFKCKKQMFDVAPLRTNQVAKVEEKRLFRKCRKGHASSKPR